MFSLTPADLDAFAMAFALLAFFMHIAAYTVWYLLLEPILFYLRRYLRRKFSASQPSA